MKFVIAIMFVINVQIAQAFSDSDHPLNLTDAERIEVLWSENLAGELDPVRFFAMTEGLQETNFNLRDRLRIAQMRSVFVETAESYFSADSLDPKTAMKIISEKQHYSRLNIDFGESAKERLKEAQKRLDQLNTFRPKTREEIIDLVFEGPDLAQYLNGKYAGGVKLFLFCRHDRTFPCLFAMKDNFDNLVRKNDGRLWTLPALAHSARGLPYYQTNGYTPSGVHSMDSVMPEPNRQTAFGKFRRVILNWIPSDQLTNELLPESAKGKTWWRAASIARDNGRKWLRIHGTGRKNTNPSSNYYPHMPTAGCVSTREGKYREEIYIDQRKILDTLMESMRLAPVYTNEVRIKGMLYVIELDDKKAKVTEETLRKYGVH